jgi:tRNA threonylcarbamoyladenosine biosynthesis protein TsaE
LGKCVGDLVSKGLTIRLTGDLGAGKTCFVQGLARGLGVPATYDITSPTYTLINEYPARLPFYHVDLYRLTSALDAEAIGLWDICSSEGVTAVEWSDRIEDEDWPAQTFNISIFIQGNDIRSIHLFGCGLQIADLIKQVVTNFTHNCANISK